MTRCQFCGMLNAEATQEAMDVHYWRESGSQMPLAAVETPALRDAVSLHGVR